MNPALEWREDLKPISWNISELIEIRKFLKKLRHLKFLNPQNFLKKNRKIQSIEMICEDKLQAI